jgi:UDP-N-acetylmuramate dehydrogenase
VSTIDALTTELSQIPGVKLERDVPMARSTTYRLGGPAAVVIELRDEEAAGAVSGVLKERSEIAPLALGRGSNLVVSDRGFPGVVIRLGSSFSGIELVGATGLRAGAAATMPQLANRAARRSLSGLEWMIAIPGSVGGAIRMNAGAHGSDTAAHLIAVKILSLSDGRVEERGPADLGMSYRHTLVADDDLVLSAHFELEPGATEEIRARMDSYRKHRAETQPGALQNAGSVFKNPPGDSAGRLVEATGLKGFAVGGASVSELHANFFISSDEATAQDVFDLVRTVRHRVREAHGVTLEPEIRFVGEFEGTLEEVAAH